MKTINIGILGCGDFLRWQKDHILHSSRIKITQLYDPVSDKAAHFAKELGGSVASSPDAVFKDTAVDVVLLFVPPWLRKDLFLQACESGKEIITTKPLAPSFTECNIMIDAAQQHGIRASVIYGRTDDPHTQTAKRIFDEGRFGKLALYRQDWIHPYPKWNKWATDPKKNGGPFMDAMIHNLNAASHLMSSDIVRSKLYSHNLSHPELACADTESIVVEYEGGGVANLFITWAADLETFGTAGNDREHIDLYYLVTTDGWRIIKEYRDDKPVLVASREGKQEIIPCNTADATPYDQFAQYLDDGIAPHVFASLEEAARDIGLITESS